MRGDFTLSYHFFKQKDLRNHLELFLDKDGLSLLETWRSFREKVNPPFAKNTRIRRFVAAPEHRRVYLSFAGHVSGHRGKLRTLRRGKFVDKRTLQKKGAQTIKVFL
ncbi:MAG: hypothetical protein LDLANPLL_00502 [Turneriella sp.]|nr:hypothetical protein [Turneriella sp.]